MMNDRPVTLGNHFKSARFDLNWPVLSFQKQSDTLKPSDQSNEIRITAWRSFGIGRGKVIDLVTEGDDSKSRVVFPIHALTSHEDKEWKQDSSVKSVYFLRCVACS
jgi:hypothetical protein